MNLVSSSFVPEHFQAMRPFGGVEAIKAGTWPNAEDLCQPYEYTWSLCLDGAVHAIAGVQERWPRVGDAWCWVDNLVLEEHRQSFARLLKDELLPRADSYFKRISGAVDVNNGGAVRLVEWLGFEREFEAPLRNFGVGGVGDYWQYVRFN